jgi:hypothetical protein
MNSSVGPMNVPSADYIANLPNDNIVPKPHEYKLLQDIFSMGNIDQKTNNKIVGELKESFIIIILFIVICIPITVSLLHMILPASKSNIYIQIAVQGIVFAIVLFFIRNFALARASSNQ